MAVKLYTVAEFKSFIKAPFDRIVNIPDDAKIVSADLDAAYDWATSQLNYELPTSADGLNAEKYQWFKNRMNSYLYDLLLQFYAVHIDIKDKKQGKIFDNFKKIKDTLDNEFDSNFIDVTFGTMVRSSGFVSNRYGEDVSYEGLNPIDRSNGQVQNIDN